MDIHPTALSPSAPHSDQSRAVHCQHQEPTVPWPLVAAHAQHGLAVIDRAGCFVQINTTGALLCGRSVPDLLGHTSPFDYPHQDQSNDSPSDDLTERICSWAPEPGRQRKFAYRTRLLGDYPGHTVVSFRDVTDERHRHRRIAAIARAATNVASQGSITAILDAVAREVLEAEPLAGVQIITVEESGDGLRIMGSAGFRRWPDFFERLVQCRDRGAPLHMLEAIASATPVVVPDRWHAIRSDPAWEPLRDYLGELQWSWFASVPLMIRGRAAGVMNSFFKPGHVVGEQTLSFLLAMAEQAAVALDYAALLETERELARREERQRLARDLHDSIVQQVFSIGMQAKVMGVLGAKAESVPASTVRRIADEVGVSTKTVLTDLRAMVHQLRPQSSTQLGLEEALRALVESTTNRTGLRFRLSLRGDLQDLPSEIAEDVYRILAEAIHNVVKHADAGTVTIRSTRRDDTLVVVVTDNGRGISVGHTSNSPDEDSGGYGVTSMRERAERWGGSLSLAPGPKKTGTRVRATIPLPPTISIVGGSNDRTAHDSTVVDQGGVQP